MDLSEIPVVRVTYPEPFPKEYTPNKAQLGTTGPRFRGSNSEGI